MLGSTLDQTRSLILGQTLSITFRVIFPDRLSKGAPDQVEKIPLCWEFTETFPFSSSYFLINQECWAAQYFHLWRWSHIFFPFQVRFTLMDYQMLNHPRISRWMIFALLLGKSWPHKHTGYYSFFLFERLCHIITLSILNVWWNPPTKRSDSGFVFFEKVWNYSDKLLKYL